MKIAILALVLTALPATAQTRVTVCYDATLRADKNVCAAPVVISRIPKEGVYLAQTAYTQGVYPAVVWYSSVGSLFIYLNHTTSETEPPVPIGVKLFNVKGKLVFDLDTAK